MLTHTEVIGGNTKQSLYLASRYQTLGKNDFGALEIPKGPAIGVPAVCSMSRSKCIVPSVAFAQLRHRAGPTATNTIQRTEVIRRLLSVSGAAALF